MRASQEYRPQVRRWQKDARHYLQRLWREVAFPSDAGDDTLHTAAAFDAGCLQDLKLFAQTATVFSLQVLEYEREKEKQQIIESQLRDQIFTLTARIDSMKSEQAVMRSELSQSSASFYNLRREDSRISESTTLDLEKKIVVLQEKYVF